MSGKGFGSPLFSKRKTSTSAAPSVTEGHDPKRLSANDKSGKLDPPALQRHIRGASTASNESAQSAVVPPPAVNINADVSAMTIDRIRAPTYIESKKLNSLQQAVHSGDMRKVKSLLQEKSRDVNKLDTYHGFSALHVAVDENKYDIAALLIHPVSSLPEKDVKMRELFETSPLKRINMNLTNREGRTALIVAVIRGYSDLVHLLIKNKAQLDVQDLLGCTALHYSILIGDISSFRLLLDARAKQSVVDKSGMPMFYHAIKLKREEMAHKLMANPEITKLDINRPHGPEKSTALHCAVSNGMVSVIHLLIDCGADPVALDSEKRKPVERIDYNDYDEEIVEFLTLTEMEMFGSITSFVDETPESKSISNIIARSVASLISPKGSQQHLTSKSQIPDDVGKETLPLSHHSLTIHVSEPQQSNTKPPVISSNFAFNENRVPHFDFVDEKSDNRSNTSPLLSFNDEVITISEDELIDERALDVVKASKEDLVTSTHQRAESTTQQDSAHIKPDEAQVPTENSHLSTSNGFGVKFIQQNKQTPSRLEPDNQSESEPYLSDLSEVDEDSDSGNPLCTDMSQIQNLASGAAQSSQETNQLNTASGSLKSPFQFKDSDMNKLESVLMQSEDVNNKQHSYFQEYTKLRKEYDLQTEGINKLKAKSFSLEENNSMLRSTISILEKRVDDEVEHNQLLQLKLNEAQNQHAEILEELSAALSEVDACFVKVKDLEEQVTSLKDENAKFHVSHITNVGALEYKEQNLITLQQKTQQYLTEKQLALQMNSKLATDLSALKSEMEIKDSLLSSKDLEIGHLRAQISEAVQTRDTNWVVNSSKCIVEAVQSSKHREESMTASYYETEISILNQKLQEESTAREAHTLENTKMLSTITNLQSNLEKIQNKFKEQSNTLKSLEKDKEDTVEALHQLEVNMATTISQYNIQVAKLQKLLDSETSNGQLLKSSMDNLQSSIANYEKERDMLKRDSVNMQQQISSFQSKMKVQTDTITKLEKFKEEAADTIQLLEESATKSKLDHANQNSRLQRALESEQKIKRELQASLDEMKESLSMSEQELTVMRRAVAEKQQQLGALQSKAKSQSETIAELQKLKNLSADSLLQNEVKMEKLKAEHSSQLAMQQSRLESEQKHNSEQSEALEETKESLSIMKQELTVLQRDFAQKDEQLRYLQANLKTQSDLFSELQTSKGKALDAVQQMEMTFAMTKAQHDTQVNNLQAALELEERSNKKLTTMMQDLEKIQTQSMLDLKTLQMSFADKCQELERAQVKCQSQANEFERDMSLEQKSVVQLEEKLIQLQKTLESERRINASLEKSSKGLKEMLVTSQEEKMCLESSIKELQAQSDEQKSEFEIKKQSLETKLASARADIVAYSSKLATESGSFTSANSMLEGDKGRLAAEVVALQNKVEQLNSQDTESQTQLSHKSREIESLQSRIDELETLSVYHQKELETMSTMLRKEKRKASGLGHVSSLLSSLANVSDRGMSQDSISNGNDNSASQENISRETLIEEATAKSSKKSEQTSKGCFTSFGSSENIAAALRDLHVMMNKDVKAVVFKLNNLQDTINSDAEKLSNLIDEVNADDQVESDVKAIFTNVVSTQCERSGETKSILADVSRAAKSTLGIFEKDFSVIVTELEDNLAQQNHIILEYEEQFERQKQAIAELDSEILMKEEDLSKLRLHSFKLATTVEKLESQLDHITQDYQSKETKMKKTISKLETEVKSNEDDLSKLKLHIFKLEADSDKVDIQQANITSLESKCAQLKQTISKLETQVKLKDNDLSAVQEQLNSKAENFEMQLKAATQTLKQTLSNLEIQLHSKNDDTSKLAANLKALEEQHQIAKQNHEADCVNLKETISDLESQLQSKDDDIAELKQNSVELATTVEKLEQQIGEIDHMSQHVVSMYGVKSAENEVELEKLRNQLEIAKSQNAAQKDVIVAMDASMQDLQKNIFQQTVEKDKLSYEIEHLQAELQSQKTREGNQAQLQTFKLQQKIETLQAELEQSQLEVENRNEQLTQFKASLSKQHLVSSQAELKVSEQNHEIQLLQFQVAHLKQSIETTWKPQYAELQQRAKELAAELHSAQKSASQFQHEHLDETDKNHVYSSSTGQKVHSDQLVVQISSLKNELEQMTLHLQQKLSSEANAAKVVVDALQLALAPMHRTLEKFAASSNLAHQVSPHQHNSQLDIEAENLQLKASKKKLLEEIDSLDNTLKDCKRELSIAQSKVLYMEDVMKKSSSLPEAQKTEVLRLQQAIDELKNELAIHTSQASKQIEKTRSLERENEELRSSYSNLRVQASALASELSATTDHLAQMRSQVVQYANQALQYEMETKTQSQVCEEARSKLQQEEQTVRGLRNELSALQHAHNTHFASLSKASNLNAFSSAERNSLIHQIKSLKKKLEKANKEVSDIQSSHDSKLQQIFNKLEQSKVVHQLYLQSVSVPSGGDLTDNTLLRGHRIKSLAADLKGILKSI